MTRLAKIAAAVLILTTASDLPGQASRPTPLPEGQLTALLKQLSSDSFSERRRATETLISGGESLRTRLRARLQGLPLEARLRVESILRTSPHATAERDLASSGTLVTLDIKDRPLGEALTILGASAGTRIRLNTRGPSPGGAVERSCSFAAAQIPFWEALDRFCLQEGFSYHRDYRSGDLLLNATAPPKLPVHYIGPFRVSINGITITRTTRFYSAPTVSMNLQLRVDAENDAPVCGLLNPPLPSLARDEKGTELIREGRVQQAYFVAADQRRQFTMMMSLNPPHREALRLSRLEFPLRVVVPKELKRSVLENPVPGEGQLGPGGAPLGLSLDWMKDNNGRPQLQVSFDRLQPEGVGPHSFRVQPWTRLVLEDTDGQVIPLQSSGQSSRGKREFRTMTLPAGAVIQRIRIESLVRYEVKDLLISFKDIALP